MRQAENRTESVLIEATQGCDHCPSEKRELRETVAQGDCSLSGSLGSKQAPYSVPPSRDWHSAGAQQRTVQLFRQARALDLRGKREGRDRAEAGPLAEWCPTHCPPRGAQQLKGNPERGGWA